MTYRTIDLTNITLAEFELVGSIVGSDLEKPTPSAQAIAMTAGWFGVGINAEIAALDPNATDATTVTLRSHFRIMREACIELMDKIVMFDRRHIEILVEAVGIARSAEDRGPEYTFIVYGHLTRTFELGTGQTFADELAREMPAPDFERHRNLLLAETNAKTREQFIAANQSISSTFH